jgi:hypothetical protein
MTLVRRQHYEAECDTLDPNCYESIGITSLDKDEVRRHAEANGWVFVGRKCYCPKCAEKLKARKGGGA